MENKKKNQNQRFKRYRQAEIHSKCHPGNYWYHRCCRDHFIMQQETQEKLPVLLNQAPDGTVLKAGLIGCGGRGTEYAANFLDAGPNLQITALGDIFQDKIDNCRAQLKKEKNVDIPDDKCFVGFDSYQKVIDSGVDLVLLCTPPFQARTY